MVFNVEPIIAQHDCKMSFAISLPNLKGNINHTGLKFRWPFHIASDTSNRQDSHYIYWSTCGCTFLLSLFHLWRLVRGLKFPNIP